MWHILRAEPGARIALGLRRAVGQDELRAAALDGSIVDLLNWIPVAAGQAFFTPAGTIHAIGAGIALCEIQQLSDVTYRLYDWGRGRELHLDAGLEVSKREPGGEGPKDLPVHCQYFRTEHLVVQGFHEIPACDEPTTFVVLEGTGTFDGNPFREGDVLVACAASVPIRSRQARLLVVTGSHRAA
jgi:mannose-6-phosphate isomerase